MRCNFAYPTELNATDENCPSYGRGFENVSTLPKRRAFHNWWNASALIAVIGSASQSDGFVTDPTKAEL